jgi:hypothetical protein
LAAWDEVAIVRAGSVERVESAVSVVEDDGRGAGGELFEVAATAATDGKVADVLGDVYPCCGCALIR